MTYAGMTKDFHTSHFEYKTLGTIHGPPDIDSVLRLFKQVKRNLQSVPTTLGGGKLGYLAMGISTASFDTLPKSNTFIRPVHPGDFMVTVPRDLRDSAVVLTTPDITQ